MRQHVVDQVHIMIQLHVCAWLTWRNGQRQVLIAHAHAHHVRAAAFPEGQKEPILARQPLRLLNCNPAHRLTWELALTQLETDMNLLEQCNRAQEGCTAKTFHGTLSHLLSLFT
jgi:hypothetical protein